MCAWLYVYIYVCIYIYIYICIHADITFTYAAQTCDIFDHFLVPGNGYSVRIVRRTPHHGCMPLYIRSVCKWRGGGGRVMLVCASILDFYLHVNERRVRVTGKWKSCVCLCVCLFA